MSSNDLAPSLSMDFGESAEARIRRLITEHPVIIFSRYSCCMCHVMRKLLSTVGVNPTVIELDDHEIDALPLPHPEDEEDLPREGTLPERAAGHVAPAVFIGGSCVGGFESLVALHLSGHLVPKLVKVGVL